jgi:hypothetical protein
MSDDEYKPNDEHKPIQPEYIKRMNDIAKVLDDGFNQPGKPKKVGFVLLVFPFGDADPGKRCNYISNASRTGVLGLLKEMVIRFEKTIGLKGESFDEG